MPLQTAKRLRIVATWCAHASAALGPLAVLGVLCFHLPEQPTSVEIRCLCDERFVRALLPVGLVAAFLLGTLAVMLGHARRVALLGFGSAGMALVLGGAVVLSTRSRRCRGRSDSTGSC